MLEKLLKSRWFVRIIAFLLALLLFLGITLDSTPTQPSANPFLTLFSSKKDPNAFEEVDLISYYNEDKYVVTGIPKKVNILLEGSASLITKAKLATNYEAYVDLSGYSDGVHRVEIMHRNIPDQLTVKTDPEFVTVTIQEKISKLIPVDIQVINDSKLPLGYAYESPIVSPNSVTVTGAKSQVNKIALIKGYINIAFKKKTVESSIPLHIYDAQGNKMENLDIYPAVIDVKVPITTPFKSVPIRVQEINDLPKGLSIVSITVEPDSVIIYGQQEDINEYEYIDGMKLNLRTIDEDKVFTMDVPVPNNITNIYPAKVKVKVQVADENKKAFSDVSVKIKGLAQGLNATFVTPSEGLFDINLLGAESVLEEITISDFEAYVDLSQLTTGEHVVDIEFNGPQYVSWEAETMKVKVKITE